MLYEVWASTAGSGRWISSHWFYHNALKAAKAICPDWEEVKIERTKDFSNSDFFSGSHYIQHVKPLHNNPKCSTKCTWEHLSKSRWACTVCGRSFNWACGCGGSMYVCDRHYIDMTHNIMIKKCGSVNAYLEKYAYPN